MKTKNVLFIIDAQYDFCNPNGALFVKGADDDMKRLSNFILENKKEIGSIVITLDTHQINDISHPNFWRDETGKQPAPFTMITYSDLTNGKWVPKFNRAEVLNYLKMLEDQKEYTHIIWPEHCIIGSKGASLDEGVFNAITTWARERDLVIKPIIKGLNIMTEHFGAFKAQVENSDVSTHFNMNLFNELNQYENIFIAGEAKSHCVANTIKQMLKKDETIAKKIVILEDTMSNVVSGEVDLGFLGKPTYDRARDLGVRFMNTNGLILVNTNNFDNSKATTSATIS